MWSDYENTRTITTLTEVVQLRLKVRRRSNRDCSHYHQPYRPECEGGWALPKHEFGLDVLAAIGNRRYRHYETVRGIHVYLREKGVVINAHCSPIQIAYRWVHSATHLLEMRLT